MTELFFVLAAVLAFIVVFAGIWMLVLSILSAFSKWGMLGESYRVDEFPSDISWRRWISARMNGVMFNNMLWVGVSERGLYLKAGPSFFYKFKHPPLLIPWSDIQSASRKQEFLRKFVGMKVQGVDIWLEPRAVEGAGEYSDVLASLN